MPGNKFFQVATSSRGGAHCIDPFVKAFIPYAAFHGSNIFFADYYNQKSGDTYSYYRGKLKMDIIKKLFSHIPKPTFV